MFRNQGTWVKRGTIPDFAKTGSDRRCRRLTQSCRGQIGWNILWLATLTMTYRHTYDQLVRFFSRVRAALAGHDYVSLDQLMSVLLAGLMSFNVKSLFIAF